MNRLIAWIRSFFQRTEVKHFNDRKRRKTKRHSAEHFGAHYYLGDLLDSLDSAFNCLGVFKRNDPIHYKMFSRVGCSIMSKDALFSLDRTANFEDFPSFGCLHLNGNLSIMTDGSLFSDCEQDSLSRLTFLYFSKQKRPYNVQGSNLTVYQLGLIYRSSVSSGSNRSGMCSVYLSISDSGEVIPLKICQPKNYNLRNGRGYVRMEWSWPDFLVETARERGCSVHEQIASLFWAACSGAMMQESGVTVRVSRGKHSVSFAIDMLRTPYFFSDRDKVVNENGHTKKIFHIVRGHYRKGSGGSKRFVKSHFRGLREFRWNDYFVKVGLAGLHRNSIFEFTGSMRFDDEVTDDFVTFEDSVPIFEREMSR